MFKKFIVMCLVCLLVITMPISLVRASLDNPFIF